MNQARPEIAWVGLCLDRGSATRQLIPACACPCSPSAAGIERLLRELHGDVEDLALTVNGLGWREVVRELDFDVVTGQYVMPSRSSRFE